MKFDTSASTIACLVLLTGLLVLSICSVIVVSQDKLPMTVIDKWSVVDENDRRIYCVLVITPKGEKTVIVSEDKYNQVRFGKELD